MMEAVSSLTRRLSRHLHLNPQPSQHIPEEECLIFSPACVDIDMEETTPNPPRQNSFTKQRAELPTAVLRIIFDHVALLITSKPIETCPDTLCEEFTKGQLAAYHGSLVRRQMFNYLQVCRGWFNAAKIMLWAHVILIGDVQIMLAASCPSMWFPLDSESFSLTVEGSLAALCCLLDSLPTRISLKRFTYLHYYGTFGVDYYHDSNNFVGAIKGICFERLAPRELWLEWYVPDPASQQSSQDVIVQRFPRGDASNPHPDTNNIVVCVKRPSLLAECKAAATIFKEMIRCWQPILPFQKVFIRGPLDTIRLCGEIIYNSKICFNAGYRICEKLHWLLVGRSIESVLRFSKRQMEVAAQPQAGSRSAISDLTIHLHHDQCGIYHMQFGCTTTFWKGKEEDEIDTLANLIVDTGSQFTACLPPRYTSDGSLITSRDNMLAMVDWATARFEPPLPFPTRIERKDRRLDPGLFHSLMNAMVLNEEEEAICEPESVVYQKLYNERHIKAYLSEIGESGRYALIVKLRRRLSSAKFFCHQWPVTHSTYPNIKIVFEAVV